MAKRKNHALRLGLLNARSLNTGSDELLVMVQNNSPDILAINETWLKTGEECLAPVIPDYKFLYRARQGKRGGGAGFYVRSGLQIRIRSHPASSLEQLWLEVQLPGATMAIGTAYRPETVPVSDALDAISESLNTMANCKYTCVLGDLNIDLNLSESVNTKEFMNFCIQHNLEQVVKEPTRITDSTGTLLDVVMTDCVSRCRGVQVIHNPCLSDHATIIVDLNIKKPKPVKQVRYKRKLGDISLERFTKDLAFISWHSVYSASDVDAKIEIFNTLLMLLFELHAPVTKIVCRDTPKPWITDIIKLMMKLRDKALVNTHRNKTDASKEYYKNLKNLTTAAIEREKIAFFNTSINNMLDKPVTLWNNIKKIVIPNNTKTINLPDHLNNPDNINDYFLELPPTNDPLVENIRISKINTQTTFNLQPTTQKDVLKIINSIKTKAAGHDNLNIEMIQLTIDVTLPIITHIVNKSIETLTFPKCWKRALVRPIPKKSCVEQLKDLRPISILPVLSKVLEKVVLNQLTKFLNDNNIIPKYQSGFRTGHGTETALLNITDDLTEASDGGLSSIMVLLDYSCAFDCLSPELLLHKLQSYGFSTDTCKWFRSFLSDREQMVITDSNDGQIKYSALKAVKRGVPQGSLLSPILFTIFTADLPNCIQFCKYHMYADDTQIYYSFKSEDVSIAIQNINTDLESISDWSTNNSLALNPLKSQMVVLGTKHQVERLSLHNLKIKIKDTDIEQVKTARNLGLIVDPQQKFVEHINNKLSNAFFKLKTLYKIRKYIKEQLRLKLVESLVLSLFNYCSSVFSTRINEYTHRAIQRVQNACIRFCFNVPKRTHITPYLNAKGMLNMKARMELQYACLVQRVLWSGNPDYLFQKLSWARDDSRSLRSIVINLLKIPRHCSVHYRGCFRFTAASIWNDLPPPLRLKVSASLFKKTYKDALLKRQLAVESLKHSFKNTLSLKKFFP
jgi:hypothetical protein